jgi:hypothetical protein
VDAQHPRHDVRDGKATPGPQDAKGLAQHDVFVGAQVDHAVRDDDIDRPVGQWNRFDLTLEELDVGDACMSLVFTSECQHLIRHIQTVGFAAWGNTARGKEDINAVATPQVRTVSPGLSPASAVGLLQPSEANSALCANSLRWNSS